MITANGKNVIKRFHARQLGQIGGSIALGVGSAAANVNDTNLQYEIVRAPVVSLNVDPNSDAIVFRAIVEPGSIKTVYEIGLWSSNMLASEGFGVSVLGSAPVAWTNGTLTSVNARASLNAVKIDYVANGTTNAELIGFGSDLSRFRDVDTLVVGYYATTNLSSMRIRMGIDASNYYEFVLPAPTANAYNVARLSRSSATRVGSPDWATITYLAVRPSATAGGAGSVYFDGLKFEPNSLTSDNLLVARTILTTPADLDPLIASDIEFSLRITVS